MTALSVSASGAAADAIERHVPDLVRDSVASRLFAKDATLWGPEAESEASIRLSWVGLATSSRPLVGEIAALREVFAEEGIDHVVLCGMGGSSLAPEVICATAGKPLVVLDSSDPDYVRRAISDDLEHSVVVVSSKSGSTVETDSQRRAYEQAFTDAGIDPAARIVVVTDPGSPLDAEARAKGYRVVNADPNVGGRYSALTAFGLVPSGLAGVDVSALLDEAESVADLLAADDAANPALRLGAALGGTDPLRDKLALVDDGSGIAGLRGLGRAAHRRVHRQERHGPAPRRRAVGGGPRGPVARERRPRRPSRGGRRRDPPERRQPSAVGGTLGAQLLLWEAATAVAGRLLGINPFDQPDVESAKQAARELLDQGAASAGPPAFVDGAVEVRALGGDWLGQAATVDEAVEALLGQLARTRLRGGDGLPRPARRCRAGRRADGRSPSARSGRRPSGGDRASSTRPGSSTRADRPWASTSRSPPPPTRTFRSRAVTSPSGRSSRRRQAATHRCSPTTGDRCSSCT